MPANSPRCGHWRCRSTPKAGQSSDAIFAPESRCAGRRRNGHPRLQYHRYSTPNGSRNCSTRSQAAGSCCCWSRRSNLDSPPSRSLPRASPAVSPNLYQRRGFGIAAGSCRSTCRQFPAPAGKICLAIMSLNPSDSRYSPRSSADQHLPDRWVIFAVLDSPRGQPSRAIPNGDQMVEAGEAHQHLGAGASGWRGRRRRGTSLEGLSRECVDHAFSHGERFRLGGCRFGVPRSALAIGPVWSGARQRRRLAPLVAGGGARGLRFRPPFRATDRRARSARCGTSRGAPYEGCVCPSGRRPRASRKSTKWRWRYTSRRDVGRQRRSNADRGGFCATVSKASPREARDSSIDRGSPCWPLQRGAYRRLLPGARPDASSRSAAYRLRRNFAPRHRQWPIPRGQGARGGVDRRAGAPVTTIPARTIEQRFTV